MSEDKEARKQNSAVAIKKFKQAIGQADIDFHMASSAERPARPTVRNLDFSNVDIRYKSDEYFKVRGFIFENCRFTDVTWTGKMLDCKFERCTFLRTKFKDCILDKVQWVDCAFVAGVLTCENDSSRMDICVFERCWMPEIEVVSIRSQSGTAITFKQCYMPAAKIEGRKDLDFYRFPQTQLSDFSWRSLTSRGEVQIKESRHFDDLVPAPTLGMVFGMIMLDLDEPNNSYALSFWSVRALWIGLGAALIDSLGGTPQSQSSYLRACRDNLATMLMRAGEGSSEYRPTPGDEEAVLSVLMQQYVIWKKTIGAPASAYE